jgi:hypothetical protein
MAEINKLSVGAALDKLRRADAGKPTKTQFDDKMDALDENIRRMKAASRRLENSQRAIGASGGKAPENIARSGNKEAAISIPWWLGILAVIGSLLLILLVLHDSPAK